jgi:SH3-like domain-containing protein
MTRFPTCILAALLLLAPVPALPADETDGQNTTRISITAPFVDIHAGPGRGFPVDHSVLRGEVLDVQERHTDWYRVRTTRGAQGWVHRLALTSPDGRLPPEAPVEASDTLAIVNLSLGSFDGLNSVEASAEASVMAGLSVGGALLNGGDMDRDVRLYSLTVRQYFEPMGRVTPWAGAGAGKLSLQDEATGSSESLTLPHVAAGIDIGWLERTRLRLEYRHHIPNSSNEDIQESDEWKAGIAVYY